MLSSHRQGNIMKGIGAPTCANCCDFSKIGSLYGLEVMKSLNHQGTRKFVFSTHPTILSVNTVFRLRFHHIFKSIFTFWWFRSFIIMLRTNIFLFENCCKYFGFVTNAKKVICSIFEGWEQSIDGVRLRFYTQFVRLSSINGFYNLRQKMAL